MGAQNDALVIGYRGYRIAEHVKSLEALRERGLVGKINVLASRASPSVIVDSVEYPGSINYDREIQRCYAESGSDNIGMFLRYCSDIERAIEQTDSGLIFPTTDRAVISTANIFGSDDYEGSAVASCPSLPIVELFQDKADTYRFFREKGLAKVPVHRVVNFSDLGNLDDGALLPDVEPPYFAKPSCPQSGGGIGAKEVSSAEDLCVLMRKHSQYPKYLVSEYLAGNDVNQNLVINPDGGIATQCTFESTAATSNGRDRTGVSIDELNDFGRRFGEELRGSFGNLDFRGAYNIEFLRSRDGEYILSEINSGRFPAGMAIFNQGGHNALEPLLSAISGKSVRYPAYDIVGETFSG